ncbi:hypothetical protein NDR87_31595 [Nocardia sp. CDC159]|uniref:Uncharacterized protein n=1 Tax=Nocardia pulmonis TaxID=2951408 RepID=A0A9X2ECK8_9NOCA|nr:MULTISPECIES: hypothetical protein [Nocardia]MCM6777905.1 hypothetical protein [Nocardia pulmonis]MCM6790924.1 hypothetical protein [Nocardia sp. CDC159]
MTTATITRTAAQLAAAALGITSDDRVRVDIARDGWDNAWCEETGRPAAVTVGWSTWDSDERAWLPTDRTVAGDIAAAYINSLLASDLTDPSEPIMVTVSRHYLRYMHPDIADAL